MKVHLMLTIDSDIKQKAMDFIQNKLNSSVSKEVENYLKALVDNNV